MSWHVRRIVESRVFQFTVLGAILLAGAVVGLETSPAVVERYGALLRLLDGAILVLFAVEILLKIASHGRRPWEFFRNSWNIFDFVIIAVCFLPMGTGFVAVLRLARILRVLRLVTSLPRLQVLVGALLRSIPSMGYVGMLLLLHFYIYAVFGTFLFGANDPDRFGSLGTAMLTLFQVVTLEGWVDVMHAQSGVSSPVIPPLYFVSFIVFGGMIILNLFIGVIMNSMQESAIEAEVLQRSRTGDASTAAGLAEIENSLAALQRQVTVLKKSIPSHQE